MLLFCFVCHCAIVLFFFQVDSSFWCKPKRDSLLLPVGLCSFTYSMWGSMHARAVAPAAVCAGMVLSKRRIVHCVGTDNADKVEEKKWPTWGPSKYADLKPFDAQSPSGKDCFVCAQEVASCRCNTTDVGDWVRRAVDPNSKSHASLKHLLYQDPLYNTKVPWLRTFMKEVGGGQRILHVQCWLCANFNPSTGGRQQLGKPQVGLAIGNVQIGQFKDHVWKREKGGGEPTVHAPEHAAALARYVRQCEQWKFEEWGAVGVPSSGCEDVKVSLEKMRHSMKIERLNHVHEVYQAVYLVESGDEYERHVRSACAKGARFFPSLYNGRTWFEMTTRLWSNQLFADMWRKIAKSPVLVPCSDEADGFVGLRVQYLDVGLGHTRPASTFFQLRFLSDASAPGIFAAIKAAFTSADARPDELKDLVFSEVQFAQKLRGFIADGASVNGVAVSPSRSARTAIEMAQPGCNVFSMLSEFTAQHSPVKLLGVWCSPHRVDLLADVLKDSKEKLPTFHAFNDFVTSLCSHLDWSGKARVDVAFLNSMMESERLRSQRMHISTKQWLSMAGPVKELLGGMAVAHAHYKSLKKSHSSSKSQKEKAAMQITVIESGKTHIIMPAYADMLVRLNKLNKTVERSFVNVNKVTEDIAKFSLWLDAYALRRGAPAGDGKPATPDSTMQRVLKQWMSKSLPQGSDSEASELEKTLRKMRRVAVPGSQGADWDGSVTYSAQMQDGGVYDISLAMSKAVLREAADEIREAASLLRDHVQLRFPRLPVMDAFQIFAASFNRGSHSRDFVDEKLIVLAEYLGHDISVLRSEYEELRVAVTRAQVDKKFEGDIAIYDDVLTCLRAEEKDFKIIEAVQLWLVIQAQNAELERDFSTKRRLEDRLKGAFTPKVLDQRLRIRACGPDPDTLWEAKPDGLHYDDCVVQVAQATLGTQREAPKKRQVSMAEAMADGMPAKRKPRCDTGGSHKPPQALPDHTREALVPREVGSGDEDVLEPASVDAEPLVLDDI